MAFVASNVLFFCGGPSLAGIGAVSVIFHGYQCIQDDRYTCWLMWLDTVATTLAAIVFVLRSAHNVTVLWCLLWVPTVLLYDGERKARTVAVHDDARCVAPLRGDFTPALQD